LLEPVGPKPADPEPSRQRPRRARCARELLNAASRCRRLNRSDAEPLHRPAGPQFRIPGPIRHAAHRRSEPTPQPPRPRTPPSGAMAL